MLLKTSELTGAALDWAVAKCELYIDDRESWMYQAKSTDLKRASFHPSIYWAQGGPIIEREKIAVAYEPSLIYDDTCRWKALCSMNDNEQQYGPTPLIAAMRCYVASKLGYTVDIPKELTKD